MPDEMEPFSVPSTALLDQVSVLTADPQRRRIFFEGLSNPLWVRPLTERSAFSKVPPLVQHENGGVSGQGWPEGEYLVRVSADVADDVAVALEAAHDTENFVVQQLVVEAALRMPPSVAARLIRNIAGYLTGWLSSSLDARKLADLVVKLMEGGELDAGLRLATALFRPRSSRRDSRGRAEAVIDGYWYRECLPSVAAVFVERQELDGLTVLVTWLDECQRLSGKIHESTGAEWSYVWRPSVRISPEQGLDDIGDALVDAIRDGIYWLAASGRVRLGTIVRFLEGYQRQILSRLAFDVVAKRMRELRGDALAESWAARGMPSLTEATTLGGERILDDTRIDEPAFRQEYITLVREWLPLAAIDERERWRVLMEHQPSVSDDRIASWLDTNPGDEAAVAVEVGAYRRRWRRDMLASIGRAALPGDLSEWLDKLEGTEGPAHEVESVSARSGSFVGSRSPVTDDELLRMSTEEILRYLESWQGSGQIFGPSIEGLAHALASAVAKEPERFASSASAYAGLQPAYVRALAEGLEKALGERRMFDWSPVLTLLEVVTSKPDSGEEVSDWSDGDPTWRWAHRSSIGLLDKAIQPRAPGGPPIELVAQVWRVIAPLTRSPDPTPEHEARYGGTNMDPLTLSLNTVRPAALRAAAKTIAWWHNAREPGDATPQAVIEVLRALRAHAGPAADPSLAVQAVFGEALGHLLSNEPEFAAELVPLVLGDPGSATRSDRSAAEQAAYDVVWTTLLATYRPYRGFVEILETYFIDRLNELDGDTEIVAGWRSNRSPRQLLIDHLLELAIRGQLESDPGPRLLAELWAHAPAELVGEALGHLGWKLTNAGAADAGVVERSRNLWDARASLVARGVRPAVELSGFAFWVRSGLFEPSWWLPRLIDAIGTGQFERESLVVDHIVEVAPDFPQLALDAFQALIEHDTTPWGRFGLLDKAPNLLAIALVQDDPSLTTQATELMHRLGQQGHVNLDIAVRASIERLSEARG